MFSFHLYFLSGSKRDKERPRLDLSHIANNNKGDADVEQLRESAEKEDPQCENTPEPAVVLTNMTSSTVAEQSGWNMTLSELDSQ